MVPQVYSTYEAKAKFSEILRKVRKGQLVIISYRGKQVAEIRPIDQKPSSLEESLERLENEGVLGPRATRLGELKPVAKRPGGLARFLEDRA